MVFDFLKGEFIDVISWLDDTRDTMVWRFDRRGQAIKMGAMDFIEKPADLSNLGDRIREAKHQRMLIVDKMNEDRMADILRRFGF